MDNRVKKFITYLHEEKKLSPNSIAAYEHDIEGLVSYAASREEDVADYTWHELKAYLDSWDAGVKVTAGKARSMAAVKSFFAFLQREQVVEENPLKNISLPRPDRRVREMLTDREIEKLLSLPDMNTLIGLRDRAMLEILCATGMKATEIVELDLADARLDMGYIKCMRKDGKMRIIPLRTAARLVNEYLVQARGKMVRKESEKALLVNHNGGRMTRQGFWKIIKKYAALMPTNKEITPHNLRYSVAARLLAQGNGVRNVQEMLGHNDVSSTYRYAEMMRLTGEKNPVKG